MDACWFLNLKDVADHLRKVDHEFTTHEATFIVYWSREIKKDRTG